VVIFLDAGHRIPTVVCHTDVVEGLMPEDPKDL